MLDRFDGLSGVRLRVKRRLEFEVVTVATQSAMQPRFFGAGVYGRSVCGAGRYRPDALVRMKFSSLLMEPVERKLL